jgi:hypothetical protein
MSGARGGFELTRTMGEDTAMRRKAVVNRPVLLSLLLALGGCAVPVAHVTPIHPLQSAASIPYHAILINVESSAPADLSKDVVDIASQLTEQVRELNAVPQVLRGDRTVVAENQLLIHLTVSKLRKVGWVKQFFLGVFAGKASMTSTVQFVDGNTQSPIGSYELFADGPGTGNAVGLTLEAVVNLLKENYGLTGA